MQPTALVYSSHNRCDYIHNDLMVQRALAGNKQILFLPMSEGVRDGDEYDRQVFSWNNFAWYFKFYKDHGLNAFPFYWNSNLRRENTDLLMQYLWSSEVVIFGGGNPTTGLDRYREIGEYFYNDPDCFNRIIHERQERGLLTIGFSAGVDQLCQYMSSLVHNDMHGSKGFGLCRNIISTSHFESGREGDIANLAKHFKHCLVFGLPNDSGLALNQGFLPSGNIWQVIRMVIDTSWHYPDDQFHIKTRQGVKIQHFYSDGRHWAFSGDDLLVRIQSQDNEFSEVFIIPPGGPIIHYWTQQTTGYSRIEDILADF